MVEISKLREQARREIEGAAKAAKKELRRFAAQQSVELAEKVIRTDIRPEDGHASHKDERRTSWGGVAIEFA